VGSLVRGAEYSVCVQDTRAWVDDNGNCSAELIPYVDQIRQSLDIVAELRRPPTANIAENGSIQGNAIPSVKFPKWTYCTASRLLIFNPWKLDSDRKGKRCSCGRGNLEQVPLVMIHNAGYLADVDWHTLAHTQKAQGNCGNGRKAGYITYREDLNAPGEITLECEECNQGKVRIRTQKTFEFTGAVQPWLEERAPHGTADSQLIQLNDVRIYKPRAKNALVIPPESRLKHGSVLDRLYTTQSLLRNVHQARTPLRKKAEFRTIASHLRCSRKEVESAIEEIENGYPLYGREFPPGSIEEREYDALLADYPDMDEFEDFVVENQSNIWSNKLNNDEMGDTAKQVIKLVESVVSVKRLKEIVVFTGFERGVVAVESPPDVVTPNIIGGDDWLPAIELYGEGVFFTLNENVLSKWEESIQVKERTAILASRYENSLTHDDSIDVSSRFMLLHTIAHQLILQLEIESGYPASSMREKIYGSEGGTKRAGVLIYVAVPDVGGTLGGLVELTHPDTLLPIFIRTFERAMWCSLDPVCAELEGQGPGLLNKAACHACSFIPEMTCVTGNTLLDRSYIKGDELVGMPSIFDFVG